MNAPPLTYAERLAAAHGELVRLTELGAQCGPSLIQHAATLYRVAPLDLVTEWGRVQ